MKNYISVTKLNLDKQGSYNFRRRRHPEWTDNYTLYRDKVQLNRLTQRQSVNIPLIKSTIKTLLKDIDDPPMLYFVNLDNNDQAEVFYNEYWKHCFDLNKTVIKDIVDKRQVMLFGRSFKHLNMMNGHFYWEVKDPQDVLVDRYVDPANLDSARHIIIEHNYQPLSSLRTNPRWDTAAVRRLQEFYSSDAGLNHANTNMMDYVEKQARMAELGVIDTMNPILGETYVEMVEHFTVAFNETLDEDEIIYSVVADDREIMYQAPLEEVIGHTKDFYWQNHNPLTTWGDETERTDFWSDGVADTLRTLNKILNAFFSQMIENRTLRNYGMNFFNSSMTDEGFLPQTFTPEPFGWYPIPAGDNGKIGDQIMHIDIPDLGEKNIEEMNFIKVIAQEASAATTTQQGVKQQGRDVTLGEIKLTLQQAEERVKSMAVYYTDSWKEFGHKYIKLLEATSHLIDPVTIHRHGRLTKKMYTKVITPEDWLTNTGYACEIKMQADKEHEDIESLQWLNAARSIMPNNPIVDEEYKKKILESAKLPTTAISEALKIDKQQTEAMQQAQAGVMARTEHPSEAMNFKDIPPEAQAGMLKQANLPTGEQPGVQEGQVVPPGGAQQQPTLPPVLPRQPAQQ